jgi:hypothetical protein
MEMSNYYYLALGFFFGSWFIIPLIFKRATSYKGFIFGIIMSTFIIAFGLIKTGSYNKIYSKLQPTGRSFLFGCYT